MIGTIDPATIYGGVIIPSDYKQIVGCRMRSTEHNQDSFHFIVIFLCTQSIDIYVARFANSNVSMIDAIDGKKIKGFEWDVSPCNEIISTVCWFSRTLVEGHPGNAAHQYWHRKTPKDRERPSKGYHTVHGGQVVNQSAVGIGMSIRSARPPLGRFTRGFPVPSRPAAARTRRAYPHGTTRQSLRNRRRSADRSGSSPAGKEFLIAGHRNPAGVDHMRGG